jgi:hypothetical protein
VVPGLAVSIYARSGIQPIVEVFCLPGLATQNLFDADIESVNEVDKTDHENQCR